MQKHGHLSIGEDPDRAVDLELEFGNGYSASRNEDKNRIDFSSLSIIGQ